MAIEGKCTDATNQQIIEGMVEGLPELQLSLTNQIAQVATRQETLAEQIAVIEECVQEYTAEKLKGLLYGYAHYMTTGESFGGEWMSDINYGSDEFVQLTDRNSPFGNAYYQCLFSHSSDEGSKPPSMAWEQRSIIRNPNEDGQYNVIIGPNYNSKTEGILLTDWTIVRCVLVTTTDPDTGLSTTEMTYVPVYGFETYEYWGSNLRIDSQVVEYVIDWNSANDYVNRSFIDDASYGLKALLASLNKARTYLTNNRNKAISMFPILSKFTN